MNLHRSVTKQTGKTRPISLRAYAKLRGVTAESVSKAVKSGRLRGSVVTVDGEPKIGDPELADREWKANTRTRADQPTPSRAAAREAPRECDATVEGEATQAGVPDYLVSRARREAAQAELAEIEVAERHGELVSVAEARADVIDKFTVVKTRILGVSSRMAQRLPHLAAEVVPLLDALLREALEELANDRDAEDGDDHDADTDDTDDAA